MIDSFGIDIKVLRIKRFGNTVMASLVVSREMTYMTCSDCGCRTQVPFEPDGSRPVYCQICYQGNRPAR